VSLDPPPPVGQGVARFLIEAVRKMSDALPPPAADDRSGGVLSNFSHRPRLIAGAAVGVAAYVLVTMLFAPWEIRQATRLLIGWNVGAWLFLLLIARMVTDPAGDARRQAHLEDENQFVLLILGIVASAAAMAAIVWEMGPIKTLTGALKIEHVLLVLASVMSAWTFLQVMFALHYAGVYFGRNHGKMRGGLQFPGTEAPNWIEFVYEAFVIGCTFATSDVNVTTPRMRRIVVIQGVVSFFFNTIVLALAINIAAGFF
jgi:uncharacterized membrane protein